MSFAITLSEFTRILGFDGIIIGKTLFATF